MNTGVFKKVFIFCFCLANISCQSQTVAENNNKIKYTNSGKFGVVSSSGKIIIDTIYDFIGIPERKSILPPPPDDGQFKMATDHFIVSKKESGVAIFSLSGKKIFDFVKCHFIAYDKTTQTVVITQKSEKNIERSTLHDLKGNQLIEGNFEGIGYVTRSDLLALIAQDGYIDEYYLYNCKNKKKTGPYSVLNVYNEDSSPFGMSEEEFAPYKKLNVIIARIGKGENEKWGVLNLKGDTILPFEYDNIRFITKEMRYHFIDKSKKPDNVELLLYTEDPKLNNNRIVFLDTNFNTYGYDQENKVIYKK